MGQFILHTDAPGDYTLISNDFLDRYMPGANGEFVKVYLWLLRNASSSGSSFELSSIADVFNCTENDVIRAIRYWNNVGLLRAVFDSENVLKDLFLLPAGSAPESVPVKKIPAEKESSAEKTVEKAVKKEENPELLLTADRVKELSAREDVVQLIFIAEQYLNKILSPSEIRTLLYFYDTLHFSPDLLEYLIEYCVSKGKRSMHYIKAVAFAWAEQNITTVEQARQENSTHNKSYYSILKAFGINNRGPVQEEIRYMDLWMNDYGFTLDLISAACSRTIMNIGGISFSYADSILQKWQKKGVHYLSDVEKVDKEHQQNKTAKTSEPAGNKSSSAKNKFNNFHQRTYNVDELEKQLLK